MRTLPRPFLSRNGLAAFDEVNEPEYRLAVGDAMCFAYPHADVHSMKISTPLRERLVQRLKSASTMHYNMHHDAAAFNSAMHADRACMSQH
jgi:hypothetical protein